MRAPIQVGASTYLSRPLEASRRASAHSEAANLNDLGVALAFRAANRAVPALVGPLTNPISGSTRWSVGWCERVGLRIGVHR